MNLGKQYGKVWHWQENSMPCHNQPDVLIEDMKYLMDSLIDGSMISPGSDLTMFPELIEARRAARAAHPSAVRWMAWFRNAMVIETLMVQIANLNIDKDPNQEEALLLPRAVEPPAWRLGPQSSPGAGYGLVIIDRQVPVGQTNQNALSLAGERLHEAARHYEEMSQIEACQVPGYVSSGGWPANAAEHPAFAAEGMDEQDIIFIKEMILGTDEAVRRGRPSHRQTFLYDIVNNTRSGLDVDKLDYFR
jgi:hypothetical protein